MIKTTFHSKKKASQMAQGSVGPHLIYTSSFQMGL